MLFYLQELCQALTVPEKNPLGSQKGKGKETILKYPESSALDKACPPEKLLQQTLTYWGFISA